jgi:meiotically up-regulated gene 157 (Mug157) protein
MTRLFALLAALAVLAPRCALAQTLVVPLTGARVRHIETRTLFHTLFSDFFLEDDATTYVQTGDIPAMWLRDSAAQTIPYVRYQRAFPILRGRFAGVIERSAREILTDPYANAFQADYHIWERKWEVDSLAWPVILAWVYWRATGDRSIFTPTLHLALRRIVRTYACEEHHDACSSYAYPYRVYTSDAYRPGTGLIWGAFRPSDDPVQYRFNIPQNALAVAALRDLERLALDGYRDVPLASQARALGSRVEVGILRYGIFFDRHRRVWMYAYETDGLGHVNLMDDANIPNLTTLPYIGWCSDFDPVYLNTRAFTLSMDNPFYFSGRYAEGLGSPHTPYGNVWPLGIIGRALTATSALEVATAITTLAETDSEQGLIHESFDPNAYWQFTRADFGWANALWAELLFRSIAGDPATPFSAGGPVLPYQIASVTPTLVPTFTQLDNAGELNASLASLLRFAGGAIPHGP